MTFPQFDDFRDVLASKANEQIVNRAVEGTDANTGLPDTNTTAFIYSMMVDLLEAYHLWMTKNQDEKEFEYDD